MASRLVAEDWLFAQPSLSGSVLAVDLFLNTGQHARLEVIPWLDLVSGSPDQFPEIIITAEGTGEDLHAQGAPHRWLARPPRRYCEWSKVELNERLVTQINEKLSRSISECFEHPAAA
jgi:hypothetical protein